MNPYVFIVGCARSGTTLLRRMVDAHPLIAIAQEQHWLPKWFERREGVTPKGFVTPELIPRLLEYQKFVRTGIGREELERLIEPGKPVTYSSFVTGIFDVYGRRQGKRRVGEKTPAYVDSIPTLHRLWPEARFVHLIRDGRDVCLSVIGWKRAFKIARRFTRWDEDPVTTIALWWERKVRLGREDGGPLGPELYREVRYEDLVSRPEEECEGLCDFLDLLYDEAMLSFYKGKTKPRPGLSAKNAWLPITSGLRDWRSQMPLGDLERFEAAAGDLLEELGYPRAFPRPSPEALEHAQKLRASFRRDVRDRGDRLLERWQG